MIEVLLVIAFIVSYAFDCQTILVRTHYSPENQTEFQALAGLVQYLSRIFIVIAIFLLSALTEAAHEPPNFGLIFGASSSIAVVLYLLTMSSERYHDALRILTKAFVVFSFRKLSDQSYWQPVNFSQPTKITATSCFSNAILLVAAVLPFYIATSFPQYRMTSVYAGQLLNFFATAIVLAVQDPLAMRLLDRGEASGVRSSMLQGRLLAHVAAVFGIAIIFVV